MVNIRCRHCGLKEWYIQGLDGTHYLKCPNCGKTNTVVISTINGRIKINTY